jgi:hypothetical protein
MMEWWNNGILEYWVEKEVDVLILISDRRHQPRTFEPFYEASLI